jgi:hypothetical protein
MLLLPVWAFRLRHATRKLRDAKPTSRPQSPGPARNHIYLSSEEKLGEGGMDAVQIASSRGKAGPSLNAAS